MNNYSIEIKQWANYKEANLGVNEFINYCNGNDIEIMDMTSHVTEIEDFMTYVFIFKVRY